MENGEWRIENGEWRIENGEWRIENGDLKDEVLLNWECGLPACIIAKQ